MQNQFEQLSLAAIIEAGFTTAAFIFFLTPACQSHQHHVTSPRLSTYPPPELDLVKSKSEAAVAIKASAHLNPFDTKDFNQEVVAPATDSAFHGEAVLSGMLLQQR